MKKIITFLIAMLVVLPGNAQFLDRLLKSAKKTAENAVERQVDKKVEQGIDKAFNPDLQKPNQNKEETKEEESHQHESGWTCPSCGTKGNTGKFCNECGTKKPEQESTQQPASPKENARATSEWNKFDFVPGDEVIFYDQLENEQLGEFPSKWELIGGEAEIQKLNGENVIALMDGVRIMPLIEPMWNYLPDVYTIEFDYYEALEKEGENYGDIEFKVMPENEHDLYHELWRINFPTFINEPNLIHYKDDNKTIHTYFRGTAITTGQALDNDNRLDKVEYNKWHHISISVNKRAVKIYYDETRVANIPNYQNPNGGYFGFHYAWAETQYPLYIKNVRFAKGAKPLYDRMMTDGKFITYGITFDVGKAVIKPESMGEINRIVKLMTDDPSLRFEVQGHTDNTGNAASNQTLSEQRAKAIVTKLVEMGIAADRLTAVGKGQTNPLADNSTDEGRAKNRRVEFVKK